MATTKVHFDSHRQVYWWIQLEQCTVFPRSDAAATTLQEPAATIRRRRLLEGSAGTQKSIVLARNCDYIMSRFVLLASHDLVPKGATFGVRQLFKGGDSNSEIWEKWRGRLLFEGGVWSRKYGNSMKSIQEGEKHSTIEDHCSKFYPEHATCVPGVWRNYAHDYDLLI